MVTCKNEHKKVRQAHNYIFAVKNSHQNFITVLVGYTATQHVTACNMNISVSATLEDV